MGKIFCMFSGSSWK